MTFAGVEIRRRDGVTIPAIWVAVALSLIIHALALWNWFPEWRLNLNEKAEHGPTRIPLQARLLPPVRVPAQPPPPVPSPRRSQPPSRAQSAPVRPAPPARPSPPVLALNAPAPEIARTAPAAPPAPPAPPTPAPPPSRPLQGDLASLIEARRRARGEPDAANAPTESEEARRNRIVASNLATQNSASLEFDPNRGGGVFQIQRMGYDRAEFVFYGWNKDIRRNSTQLIDVRRENNPDIRIAIVRRMIVIIREHEKEDFTWDSQRLGRSVTLSARQRDTEGLEAFLMREFFPG